MILFSHLKPQFYVQLVYRATIPFTAKRIHNGENDSHKRQFLALGVHSQSWILDNLSKKISCQIDWCYKVLAKI